MSFFSGDFQNLRNESLAIADHLYVKIATTVPLIELFRPRTISLHISA